MNSASKKSTPTKSSFQTPYKTTPTKTPESPTPSTAKVVVHAPVFIPKTIGNAHDKETVTPMKTAIVRDGKDAKYTEGAVSLLSKRMSSETNSRLDGKGKENLDNKERIQNTGGARNKYDTNEKTSGSEAFFTGDNKHIDIENINGSKDIANDDKVIADTSVVIIEEKEPSTDENSFDDRMDDCTQNDDAEIFYCNLVEARKHQEELIKQKQKLKIQPVQGRLYRQKQSSRRWKLRDFVRALRQGCRQVR